MYCYLFVDDPHKYIFFAMVNMMMTKINSACCIRIHV